MSMTQQVLKYPKRADTLALFKARERVVEQPRLGNAATRQAEITLCLGMCAPR